MIILTLYELPCVVQDNRPAITDKLVRCDLVLIVQASKLRMYVPNVYIYFNEKSTLVPTARE